MTHVCAGLRRGLGLTLLAALVVPPASWGQAARGKKGAPGAVEIEEITVTAQKREENLQEIPISVTAVTGAALEQKGSATVVDLVQSVPNLNVVQNSTGYNALQIEMRGAVNQETSLAQNTVVGLYVDGAPIFKGLGSNLDLEDLDRVEVLRGPQGTLYGKNTTGGAINLITRKPTEERSIAAATEVGNYDAFKGRVTLNVPLIGKNGFFQSDALGTLSLRENVVYRSHDGFVRDQSPTAVPATGPAKLQDLNRVLTMTTLRWQPTRDLTFDYSFEYHRAHQSPVPMQISYLYPGTASYNTLLPYLSRNRADAIGNSALRRRPGLGEGAQDQGFTRVGDDINHRMQILTGTWELGKLGPLGTVTLKSISSYRNVMEEDNLDLDGSPLHIAEVPYGLYNIEHWSEELQWLGTAPRVHYVLGAFYSGTHTTEGNQQVYFDGAFNFFYRNTGRERSFAPFGQITVTPPVFGDRLSITAGLRYTADNVHMRRHYRCVNVNVSGPGGLNLCNIGIPGLLDFDVSLGKSFRGTDGLTPMGDISYQWTDDLMTYVRVSRGYNSGAPNGRAGDVRLFNITGPEKLWSYEAGFKSQWFGNRLRFNADGFLSRYTDQVVAVVEATSTSGGVATFLQNAGQSEFWGAEVEMTAVPLRGVEATATYSYLDARYLKWQSQQFNAAGNPVFDAQGNPVLVNVAHQMVIGYNPANQASAGLTYTAPPTTAGTFSAHIDMSYQDSFDFSSTPTVADRSWSHIVVNGRLQLADIPLQKGSLDLAVFSRNLLDEKFRVGGVDFGSSFGWIGNVYGDRRTFGIGLTYRFTTS